MIRERPDERLMGTGTAWTVWPINWSAVITGAMCAVVAAAILGLIGTAIGANATANSGRITSWSGVGFGSLVYAVISSFFAFVIGGWVAARIAGMERAETRMKLRPGPGSGGSSGILEAWAAKP